MRLRGLCVMAVMASVGCNMCRWHRYDTCPSPCADERRVRETVGETSPHAPAPSARTTVPPDAVKRLSGISPTRLREAIEAALAKGGYPADRQASSPLHDEVRVRTLPMPANDQQGTYLVHHVRAIIERGTKQISLEVWSQAYRLRYGRPIYFEPPKQEPESVLEVLKSQLPDRSSLNEGRPWQWQKGRTGGRAARRLGGRLSNPRLAIKSSLPSSG